MFVHGNAAHASMTRRWLSTSTHVGCSVPERTSTPRVSTVLCREPPASTVNPSHPAETPRRCDSVASSLQARGVAFGRTNSRVGPRRWGYLGLSDIGPPFYSSRKMLRAELCLPDPWVKS